MEKLYISQEILDIIKNETDSKLLHDKLITFHPFDIAQIFPDLEKNNKDKIYQALDKKELANIFEYLDEEAAALELDYLSIKEGASILDEMETDDAVDVLNELEDEELSKKYLKELDSESSKELKYLSAHEENTAGSIMTTNYIELDSNMDVKDAMKILVKSADESEVIDPLFVSSNGKLIGLLSLKNLIVARSPKTINEIMEHNFYVADVNDNLVETVRKIQNYDNYAIPVTDNNKLVGIITMDDAMDVIEDEVKEDYGRLVGISTDIDEDKSVFKTFLKRIPWLLTLLVISLLITNIVSVFEEAMKQVIVLVFFQTLILGMAGNAGTQSLAVAVRGISRGEINTNKKVLKHLGKELMINTINSILLGILSFIVCFIFLKIKYTAMENICLISLVVSLSMVITLIISGLLGAIIPLIFSKIKIDPALASGPVITTLNDVVSISIYFSIAILLLNITM